MQTLQAIGEYGANLLMRYPEQACVVMAVFLIGIAIHAATKLATRYDISQERRK